VLLPRRKLEFGSDVLSYNCWGKGTSLAAIIRFKGCREIDGPYEKYIKIVYEKPSLLLRPILPKHQTLHRRKNGLSRGFNHGFVVL